MSDAEIEVFIDRHWSPRNGRMTVKAISKLIRGRILVLTRLVTILTRMVSSRRQTMYVLELSRVVPARNPVAQTIPRVELPSQIGIQISFHSLDKKRTITVVIDATFFGEPK